MENGDDDHFTQFKDVVKQFKGNIKGLHAALVQANQRVSVLDFENHNLKLQLHQAKMQGLEDIARIQTEKASHGDA